MHIANAEHQLFAARLPMIGSIGDRAKGNKISDCLCNRFSQQLVPSLGAIHLIDLSSQVPHLLPLNITV